MTGRFILIFAAISSFIFVALGTLDAHMLSEAMGTVRMGWIRVGLEYQAFHTLAILGLAVTTQCRISIWLYWSSAFLALGTVLFSDSLYCLALPHPRSWVFATPTDDASFLAGWALVLVGTIHLKHEGVNHE